MEREFNILNITSPDFLKELSIAELVSLCNQIREFIIENVSITGGHLSSNLGSVESIVAMHYVFDSPRDKFLFDVGHQAYTHKILTGRAKDFINLRKKDGLNGYPKYSENENDVWESGHSSTTISVAGGFIEAKEVNNNIGDVICYIGDGAIQNGVAFEGLNYLGSQKDQKAIIIFNDNKMSIGKNVGRVATRFSRFRIKKSYVLMKKTFPRGMVRLKNAVRSFVYGKNIFATMGYKYYGPIDGNNVGELIKFYKFAKELKGSTILHIITKKGKGYQLAEADTNGSWHGVKPFDIATGESFSKKNAGFITWSEGIANIVKPYLEKNEVRLISPATLTGSHFDTFLKNYDEKIIDVGINEEHAMVMAAAMSRNGIIPIVSIYSTFLQRAYDYINNDIARQGNHVIMLVDRAGLVPGDGSTHQGVFDVSILAPLPGIIIANPRNLDEAQVMMDLAYKAHTLFVIRYPKCLVSKTTFSNITFDVGSWEEIYPINEINIITYGDEINEIMDSLKNQNIGLINARFIKPMDISILKKLSNKRVIVLEEVIKVGSLASMIMMYNCENKLNMDIMSRNVHQFLDVSSRAELKKEIGIDKQSIINLLEL